MNLYSQGNGGFSNLVGALSKSKLSALQIQTSLAFQVKQIGMKW